MAAYSLHQHVVVGVCGNSRVNGDCWRTSHGERESGHEDKEVFLVATAVLAGQAKEELS